MTGIRGPVVSDTGADLREVEPVVRRLNDDLIQKGLLVRNELEEVVRRLPKPHAAIGIATYIEGES
jgi:hypothetical protein